MPKGRDLCSDVVHLLHHEVLSPHLTGEMSHGPREGYHVGLEALEPLVYTLEEKQIYLLQANKKLDIFFIQR